MAKNEKKYFDSEAKRRWIKENTKMITIKLNKNTDKDILEYIEAQKENNPDFSYAGIFKHVIRQLIEDQDTGSD